MKIGILVNPLAGIGGAVGLKGSDGEAVVARAFARGAQKRAGLRMAQCLRAFAQDFDPASDPALEAEAIEPCWLTVAGEMGADVLRRCGLTGECVYQPAARTQARDTREAVDRLLRAGIDLLLFAGGDGTARDVHDALEAAGASERLAVIGVPAGCKIHSAVYALTPKHAGELLASLCRGQPLRLDAARVMDLDEDAFRRGEVRARCYGYLQTPQAATHMQADKQGSLPDEAGVRDDIASEIIETMEDGVLYLIGSGSTPAAIMDQLGLPNTLLGIDLVRDGERLLADADEAALLQALRDDTPARLIVTPIGGQGHVFGRGNQPLSPAVLQRLGLENILLIATPAKLRGLQGRPLVVDTGDEQVNAQLRGLMTVITGYQQRRLMPVI